MAANDRPAANARTVEQVLRELEKQQRASLLPTGKPLGLLSMAAPGAPASLLPSVETAVSTRPNIDPRLPAKGGGLLSLGQPGQSEGMATGGLLGASALRPPQRSRVAQAGNFLDDFLFGGAAGERRDERRGRDDQRAMVEAHRQAFAAAQTARGFDPNLYGARMAELGQAPDMSGLVNLEGINDGRDVRGFRSRQEERGVTAGALAPVTRLPEAQRPDALAGVAQYLETQGYGFDPNTSGAGIDAAVGAGMGADSYLDNDRGDRNLAEQQRAAQSAEVFRNTDLGFRKEESQWERQFRESRAQSDDSYRAQELDVRREAMTIPNSTGDVLAPILSKVATMGVEGLNEGERLIWERYQQSGQNPFAALMGGVPGAGPAAPAAPVSQPQADPFPGISEGETITQDGKRYVRRGNQMIEVR